MFKANVCDVPDAPLTYCSTWKQKIGVLEEQIIHCDIWLLIKTSPIFFVSMFVWRGLTLVFGMKHRQQPWNKRACLWQSCFCPFLFMEIFRHLFVFSEGWMYIRIVSLMFVEIKRWYNPTRCGATFHFSILWKAKSWHLPFAVTITHNSQAVKNVLCNGEGMCRQSGLLKGRLKRELYSKTFFEFQEILFIWGTILAWWESLFLGRCFYRRCIFREECNANAKKRHWNLKEMKRDLYRVKNKRHTDPDYFGKSRAL